MFFINYHYFIVLFDNAALARSYTLRPKKIKKYKDAVPRQQ